MASNKDQKEILAHLRVLNPKVRTLACEDEGSSSGTFVFVPVAHVAYLTTDFKRSGYTLMAVADDGGRYFMNLELGELDDALVDYPHFLRSGKQYFINLLKIRRSRVNRARDLLFVGSDQWVKNAVSPNSTSVRYLDNFKARFLSDV